ncbi:prepilin-type N-terminal cleavage/methylation domain-containing protein [Candidatus Uhrbacteria bacterium]|nr:prepilin-type N-terminal cleavage/methylation domain-containing protein [Candidatus Uhrbacteria bacterium]
MRHKGFTLVELLVAIGIIGILSSIAVVSVSNVRAKARDAKRIADVKQIQTALESYFNDQNAYPATKRDTLGGTTAAVLCGHKGGAAAAVYDFQAAPAAGAACDAVTYLNPVPANPKPNGKDYAYEAVGGEYILKFKLESGSGTLTAADYEATPNGIIKK